MAQDEERRLFEVAVDVPGHGNQGWTVWLTKPEAQRLHTRLQFAKMAGAASNFMKDDLVDNGISYEEALETVKRGDFVESEAFRKPALTADPYLFIINYKPTFFGLKSGKNIGFVTWVSSHQRDRIAGVLNSDGRVESFEVIDSKANIDLDGLNKILAQRGITNAFMGSRRQFRYKSL